MNPKEKIQLMLICGALHDIAEKCSKESSAQIKVIQIKLEEMVKDKKPQIK